MPWTEIQKLARKKPMVANLKGDDHFYTKKAIDLFISYHVPDKELRDFNVDEMETKNKKNVLVNIMEAPLSSPTRVLVLRGDVSFINERASHTALLSVDGGFKSPEVEFDCRTPKGRRLRPAIKKLAKFHDLTLDKADMTLVSRLFPGSFAVLNNVFTLTSIAGPPFISTLEVLLKQNVSRNVWAVTKAILDRDTSTALRTVQDLLDAGLARVQILGAVARQTRLILYLQSGVDLSEYCNEYEVYRLESMRGLIKPATALQACARLTKAEMLIKRGDKEALEEAILFLCKQKR